MQTWYTDSVRTAAQGRPGKPPYVYRHIWSLVIALPWFRDRQQERGTKQTHQASRMIPRGAFISSSYMHPQRGFTPLLAHQA